MADVTPPDSGVPPRAFGGLPAAILIGIATLLFVGMLFLSGIVIMAVTRSTAGVPAVTATVTLVAMPGQPIVMPTTTPAPTPTPTVPPTPVPASATPTIEASPTEAMFVTAKSGANIRSGPGPSFPIVGLLGGGETAPVVGKNATGEWLAIAFKTDAGDQAWVSAAVVNLSGDVAALPVVETQSNS